MKKEKEENKTAREGEKSEILIQEENRFAAERPENPFELEEEKKETTETEIKTTKILKTALVLVTTVVMLLTLWGIGKMVTARSENNRSNLSSTATTLPTPLLSISTPAFKKTPIVGGLPRDPQLQTTFSPTVSNEKRTDVLTYIVEPLDSIFSIAEKFGLKPETVLWSNRYTIGDTPDGLYVGEELVILPEDGVYHMWSEGEGLNGVSNFYGVDPDVIVNHPLNNLDPDTIGDYSLPNIAPGTMLVVPGGTRPTVSWVVARDNPAEGSKYLGPNYCTGTLYGAVGTGTFVYPTVAHYLSGYDWNPPVHNGLDFAGVSGSLIFAADTGVVVYSGWSDRGYGNLLVVDHDDGWQTMYAHLLDGSFVPCGTNVYQGEVIGYMGSTGRSTGPHLHFELRYKGSAVNPWDYLQ